MGRGREKAAWESISELGDEARPVVNQEHADNKELAEANRMLDRPRGVAWLALLLMRTAELATGDTWRNLRDELDRLHLVTMATAHGHVAQRGQLTDSQRDILATLELPTPPHFIDFTPTSTAQPDRYRP